jgi:DNA-binding transcriptional LysR family regulator
MLKYTLRQLEYVVAVADCGSVAKAAARLYVSQPSVSSAIAKLERQFGIQLFNRHHAQGVSLTPAGRRILVDARGLLRHAQELQQSAGAAGDVLAGELELGCFVTLAPVFMPALITEFADLLPGVEVKLKEGVQDELVAGLVSGRFELAFLYDLDLPKTIHVDTLASFQPYVLLPEAHRLADRKKIPLASLEDEPLILLDVPPSRNYFMGLFRAAGLEPRIAFSSPSIEMVRGLVARKRGYSLLVTRPFGDRAYDGQKLVTRPLSNRVMPGNVCLARLRQSRPTRLMEAFSDFCRRWFSETTKAEAASRTRSR